MPGRLVLAPGEWILLLTDGILEAQAKDGEEFGEERVLELARTARTRSAAEIIRALLDTAQRFGDPHSPRQDDMTAIVVKR